MHKFLNMPLKMYIPSQDTQLNSGYGHIPQYENKYKSSSILRWGWRWVWRACGSLWRWRRPEAERSRTGNGTVWSTASARSSAERKGSEGDKGDFRSNSKSSGCGVMLPVSLKDLHVNIKETHNHVVCFTVSQIKYARMPGPWGLL